MILKAIKGILIRKYKYAVYRMVKEVEKENAAQRNAQLLKALKFHGSGIRINGRCHISEPNNVSIGNNVHIGDNAYFNGYGGLVIGDNVHMSRNVAIYTYNHNYHEDVLPYGTGLLRKPVSIGKNVWIGMNVSIVPGVTIGEGAIVGMGTVVTADIPPLAIIGSPLHRVIKDRDKEHYFDLERKSRYGGVGGTPLASDELKAFR